MSSHVFPLPAGVLSQPNITVFPGSAPAPVVPSIIQLAQQECTTFWQTLSSGVGAGVEGAWKIFFPFAPGTLRENKWFSIIINSNFTSNVDRFAEFDIGVGLAGFEVPFMDDLPYSRTGSVPAGGNSLGVTYTGAFDTPIPAASQVSVRIKDNNAAALNYRGLLQLWAE